EHGLEGRGDQERLDAHIDQAGDGAGRIGSVEGAEDQMAVNGGVDGNLRGLEVAHFTNHDDVGVLAQERAQGLAERQAHALVDGDLHDAFDVIFDGVLGGQQLRVDGIDAAQARVKGRRFAAAGRARDDHDAVGAQNGFGGEIVDELGQAEGFDFEVDRGAVQNAEHDGFAELRGQGRDAQVDDAGAHGKG